MPEAPPRESVGGASVAGAQRGPDSAPPLTAGAFFDVDGTLVGANTADLYIRYLRRLGEARRRDLLRVGIYLLAYRFNLLDVARIYERSALLLRGRLEVQLLARCRQWYREMVQARVFPEMRRLVMDHRVAGRVVAILSSTTPYVAMPLAEDLGIPHLIVTRLEVVDGCLTGAIVKPLCFGADKAGLLRSFAQRHAIDLGSSYFYSDSVTDLPTLEVVGHPRVVHPDPLLLREAQRRGWPVLRPCADRQTDARASPSAR